MISAIIDIGSNTIRTVVYDIRDKEYKIILNEREFAGIISYVKNGLLDDSGASKLVSTLTDMANLCRLLHCDEIHCFATASLRNVRNSTEVLNRIRQEAGLTVQLLSGEDEAHYDFVGMRRAVEDDAGVGLDLGGGSCQIFCYSGEKVTASTSLKIGSLFLFTEFVHGILPTEKERKAIKKHVKNELSTLPELKNLGHVTLYAMGGTARAAAKLEKKLTGVDKPIAGYTISLEELGELTRIIDNMGVVGVRLISQIIPERIHTIVPGIITLKTICKFTGAQQIKVLKNGVREGYLWEKVLQKK